MDNSILKEGFSNTNGSYLWEVIGEKARMYLLGTAHILPKDFFPLKDKILKPFDKCNNLVLEIFLEPSTIENLKITDDIIYNKDYTYEEGDSLYNHFPKDKVISLRNYLVKQGLCSTAISKKFYKLKPEVVNELIYSGIKKKSGIDQDQIGIDHFLTKRALSMKKNILELETIEFQENLLSSINKKNKLLQNNNKFSKNISNDNINKHKSKELALLNKGWVFRHITLKILIFINGNIVESIGELYKNEDLIKKARKKAIANNSPLLAGRDENMAKKIKEFLNISDSYFVAVGAMHLLGEGSIIDILKKDGYKVNRIL